MKQYKSIEETIAEVRQKDKKYNYIILIVILLMIAVIAGIIIFSQNKKNKANVELIAKYELELKETERLKRRDSLRTDSIIGLVTTLSEELEIIERDLNNKDIPRTDRATALANVNLAQDKLTRITSTISDNTIVRYYKRKADGTKIERLITSAKNPSFTLNIKKVVNDNGLHKINTIYYGKNVDMREVNGLILSLMSIGVEIKNKKPIEDKKQFEWKSNFIEIGYEPVASTTKSITIKEKPGSEKPNRAYNVRFYSYKPDEKTKNQLTQFIKDQKYELIVYPDWKKKLSFFSDSPTVFYYSNKSKAKAEKLKNDLNKKNFGITFKVQRGKGFGIDKDELDNTFIVHYTE